MTDREKIITILKTARELISDQSRWTVGSFARTEDGKPCSVANPAAYQFCSSGAVQKAISGRELKLKGYSEAMFYLRAGIQELVKDGVFQNVSSSIMVVNDMFGHQAVMQMYDRAIEIAGIGRQ